MYTNWTGPLLMVFFVMSKYENCNNKKSENLNHCKNQWIKTQEFCENKLMNKIRNLPYKDIVLFYLFCFMIIVSF